jgi:hypothetical protein
MNYFAHGRAYLDDPYFLAGTALPDWLSVACRRVRVRSATARRFASDQDKFVSALARGVVQHHHDDEWFHRTRAFAELSWQFTAEVRDRLPRDDGLRPSFLGHILVELLLDGVLAEDAPHDLGTYYAALATVDASAVRGAVHKITGTDVPELEGFIPQFLATRFLYDYAEDGKLLFRLNQVMRRVGLRSLPEQLCGVFPSARRQVRRRAAELLEGPPPRQIGETI